MFLPYMLVDPDFRDSAPGVVIGGKVAGITET